MFFEKKYSCISRHFLCTVLWGIKARNILVFSKCYLKFNLRAFNFDLCAFKLTHEAGFHKFPQEKWSLHVTWVRWETRKVGWCKKCQLTFWKYYCASNGGCEHEGTGKTVSRIYGWQLCEYSLFPYPRLKSVFTARLLMSWAVCWTRRIEQRFWIRQHSVVNDANVTYICNYLPVNVFHSVAR